jgi:hypothetical protein
MKKLTEAARIMREQAQQLESLAAGPEIERLDDLTIREATQRLAGLDDVDAYEISTTLKGNRKGEFALRFVIIIGRDYHFGDSLAEAVDRAEAANCKRLEPVQGEAAIDAAQAVVDGVKAPAF